MDVYTDAGFDYNTKTIGIGILIIDNDKEERLGFNFSKDDVIKRFKINPSPHIGEFLAIYLATKHTQKYKLKINLFSDCLTVLNKLTSNKEVIKNIKINKEIDYYHIKGHCGVYGNLIADKIASNMLKSKQKIKKHKHLKNLYSIKQSLEYYEKIV